MYMKGYVSNIEELALNNRNFREVIYTDKKAQLVLMSLLPGEDIGEEAHDVDQFFRVDQGAGTVILDGETHEIMNGTAILVPAGVKHNLINGSSGEMKLYTLYMPPQHKDGTIHVTKAAAEADHEHFDGVTTQ